MTKGLNGCYVYYLVHTGNQANAMALVNRWARAVYIDRHYDSGIFIDVGTGIQGPFSSPDAARAAIRVATGEMV